MALFYMDPFEGLNTSDFESPSQFYVIRRPKRHGRHHQDNQHHKIQKMVPKDSFHVTVDVQHFHPHDITVKAIDKNTVIVEGKHEEKEDEHGSVYRHFVRKYIIGDEYDTENVEARLSTDGVLSITIPKVVKTGDKCRVIPITRTEKPARIQAKQDDGDKKMDTEQ